MVKVSVVVPVYNQEKYIERCVDSILAQTLQEIEVILVDDGSTDTTPEILNRYVRKDERVIVLKQQNRYAGVARNTGLKAAQGEYVIFWDSDDYFAENALEVLYEEIQKYDADICVGEATKMDTQTGSVRECCYLNWNRIPEKRPFNAEDIPQYIFNFGKNCAWNKLYKKSFLDDKNLQFSKLKQTNDVYFVMKAFVLAEKITVVDKVIVYYQFRNSNSLSGDALKIKENVVKAFLEVKDFLIESGKWENQGIKQSFINNFFSLLVFLLTMFDDYEEYQKLYNYYKEEILPTVEIGEAEIGLMYSEKNAYELSCMLESDVEEFIFKQYMYCLKNNQQNRDKVRRLKIRVEKTNAKNLDQKEKIESMKLDRETKREKIRQQQERIQQQKEKIVTQKEKIQRQSGRIQKLNDKIQRQGDKIQRQSDKIQRQSDKIQRQSDKMQIQSDKIQDQKALLDQKLVKAALKVHNFFHTEEK